jgi:hypothetical protein
MVLMHMVSRFFKPADPPSVIFIISLWLKPSLLGAASALTPKAPYPKLISPPQKRCYLFAVSGASSAIVQQQRIDASPPSALSNRHHRARIDSGFN